MGVGGIEIIGRDKEGWVREEEREETGLKLGWWGGLVEIGRYRCDMCQDLERIVSVG